MAESVEGAVRDESRADNEDPPLASSSVECVLSTSFGLVPGSSSCICRGCYLNCLSLETSAFFGGVGEAINPCLHLVDENGANVVNVSASRVGRIHESIWKQAVGKRYVICELSELNINMKKFLFRAVMKFLKLMNVNAGTRNQHLILQQMIMNLWILKS